MNAGLALLIGAVIGVVLGNPKPLLTKKLAHHFLFASVAGLGAGLGLHTLVDVGARGLLGTIAGIIACLTLGFMLSRVVGLEPKLALLVTVGTAICGGSAIAAIGPVVRADEEESSLALATVFVLNGVALFLFPAIGHLVHMSGHQFGWWSAIAIHDTSSVVGASMRFGDGAVDLAVPLKLTRALYIVPVALGISAFLPHFSASDIAAEKAKAPWPWLAIAFLIVSALFTFVPALASVRALTVGLARHGMELALFFLGLGLTRETLKKLTAKPLVFGIGLWVVMAAGTLAAVVTLVAA
jgi:uncharacterized integral membrane protein (TIGR00698 family)